MSLRQQDRLRAMYVGGYGNRTARGFARFWNAVLHLGLLPRRWVTLEVRGCKTGQLTRFPLGMADVGGEWYLVSMLGECQWVRNVRAARGQVTLRRRHSRRVTLQEIPVPERAPIIRRYVQVAPGGRPHIAVDRRQPAGAFERIAADHPVFRVTPYAGH